MLTTQIINSKPIAASCYIILSLVLLVSGCSQKSEQASAVPLPADASKDAKDANASAKAATESAAAVTKQDEEVKAQAAAEAQATAADKNTADTGVDWKNMREDGSFPPTKAKVITQAELAEMSRQTIKALEEAAKKAKAAGY
jgi:hypothetical protein